MAFRIPREARSTRTVGNRSGIPVGARFVRDLHPHADAICEPPWRVCEQHAARRSRYGVAKDHALADFRRRSKFSMPFALMAGQVGTPNSRAALSAVSMPGALFVPLADK